MKPVAWFLLVGSLLADPLFYVFPPAARQAFIWHISVAALVFACLILLRQEQIADPNIGEGPGSA